MALAMNDLPIPRYRIGDVVYWPTMDVLEENLPCPDCLGTTTWRVESPAGEVFSSPCPRCQSSSFVNLRTKADSRIPGLRRRRYAPSAKMLTIGQINATTAEHSHQECRVHYMCRETGVGSGSSYPETRLHPTEASALDAAMVEANRSNALTAELPEVILQDTVSDMTLSVAAGLADWSNIYNAWDVGRKLREAVDEVLYKNQSCHLPPGDIRDHLEDVVRQVDTYDFVREHPLDELLRLVLAGDFALASSVAGSIVDRFGPSPKRKTC